MQPAAVELLRDLAPVLGRWGRWYVFGAQAVAAYGVPRLSADVDVTLAITPDLPEAFARQMEDAGFALRVADPEFIRRTRVMPLVHQRTGMPLDVVLAGSGLEDEFLDRATRVAMNTVREERPDYSGPESTEDRRRYARSIGLSMVRR